MDFTAQPSEHKLDVENFLTKEEVVKQLELSGVNLGDDPGARIDTFVAAGLLPLPQFGRFPTWTVQRIIAIENKLAAGQSLEEIQKEVQEERRRFLSGVKDLNSLVSLYKKLQKNSAFFLFSFLLLFVLSMGVVASSIIAPGNPVVVAGKNTLEAAVEGAGKVARVAAAPVGQTLVTIIKTSIPEDTKAADPLQLTNLKNIVLLDDLGNLLISGNVRAAGFSGSGKNLTSLPASEVIGELAFATVPWTSVTTQPIILSSLAGVSNDEGDIALTAGTGIAILTDDSLDRITISSSDTGSSQAIFKNIAVSGQSTVVADANDDTLTFIAGSNIALTTDATADSVTFSVIGTVGNADTLDLLDSTQFLRSDTADQFTSGTLTFNAGTTLSVLGSFTCTDCIDDAAVANNITISATGAINAGAVSSGTLGAAGVTLALGSFGSITGALGDANVADTLTIGSGSSVSASAINSGTLGIAAVTLALGSFGSITGELGDANVANTITASNYLPLAGGTMVGSIDLNANLLLNIGNAGTDFTPTGGLTLADDLAVNGGDITSSGALTITPAAESNLNVSLSGAGDFAVNTDQFYVDTNLGNVGIGTGAPSEKLTIAGGTILQTSTTNPTVEGSVQDVTNLNDPYGIYVSGKYAYVTSSQNGRLTIVDITRPSNPTVVGSIAGINGAWGVHVAGKYAYVAAQLGNSLAIVDVSNPSLPSVVGTATGLNLPRGVYVSGKYAYVADFGANRLSIVDVSDPTAPYVIGSVTDATNLNSVEDIYVSGKYAYVTAATNRVTSVDVSNPAAPSVANSLQDATNLTSPEDIHVSGRYAYVAAMGASRLTVVNITNPSSMSIAGSVQDASLGNADGVYVSGRYAYVIARSVNRLTVVDISNPGSPSVSASVEDGTNLNFPEALHVTGKYAYVTTDTDRLTVVSVVGIDAPAAYIGAISASDISVSENLDVYNDLYVGGGLSVGPGGILTKGAIGAGTSTSTHILTGMLCIRNATACPAQAAGRLYVDTTGTAGADDPGDVFDIAEYFPATESVEPGDVLIADPNQAKAVKRSSESYQGSLIGIVSTTPAVTIDEGFFAIGANKFDPTHPYVALAGRVPTKVSTENGPIFIGDPLTSSSTPGVAMKATRSGPIVGKALDPFICDKDRPCQGKIMVFVAVGWYIAPLENSEQQAANSFSSIDVETLTAGTVNTQVLFVGNRKLSMATDGSLSIEGDVKITGSLIARQIKTDELVVSEKSSGTRNIKAGAKEVTIENALVKATSKILITFSADYSPVTRYYVTKEEGKSFALHLDQPVAHDATFDWLIIN